MADADGPLGRAASDAKFDRYADALLQYGIPRWAVESADGALLGYCGVMVRLGLVRTPERDVVHLYEGREWPLLVWEVPAGG